MCYLSNYICNWLEVKESTHYRKQYRYVQDWTLMRFKFLMISITKCPHWKKSRLNTHTEFCQIWNSMKISNNPVKYEVLIKQYLRSTLDISKTEGHGVPSVMVWPRVNLIAPLSLRRIVQEKCYCYSHHFSGPEKRPLCMASNWVQNRSWRFVSTELNPVEIALRVVVLLSSCRRVLCFVLI